ncbi:proline--tRNA ligase [Sporosarcina sp. Te-1]|uniref:proline--tRNA ligase n=1 Tax=Sporosarcina sp. Te-1 TaxID=2818390 RepID=UPI001A9D9B9D|nr:proline--tRNA ligase [Sporosarcina sp. Te-1]QTD42293.1 proline--tRNA ligase [Sporosarcina sp. Te-1]
MKQSRTFIPTMRETPADIDATSHQMLVKAGYIRTNVSGVYTFLPLAQKVILKIENIIREEMEHIGAVEMAMPLLQHVNETTETADLFTAQDHKGRRYILRSTDEDLVTALINDHIVSYKQLPLTLYQMQKQFRDVQRPKFGLLQSREFLTKDAYSFHTDENSMHTGSEEFKQAYSNIFTRLGLNYRMVNSQGELDAGNDVEFFAMSSIGDDMIAYSDSSSYAASLEWAEVKPLGQQDEIRMKDMEKVATPNMYSVREVADFLHVQPNLIIKTLLYTVDDEMVAVLCRGDHEINEAKLKRHLNATQVHLASVEEVRNLFSAEPGSIGPVKLPVGIKVVADHAIHSIVNGICGANETDFHLFHVNPERDFAVDSYMDLRFIQEGDPSPDGMGSIRFARGITIGYMSKINMPTRELVKAGFQNKAGEFQHFLMGSYHIGVSRVLAALVEQFNDADGIKWPRQLAPFDIHLITVNTDDELQHQLSEDLYHLLRSYRYDVLYDDRQERPGVKFIDSDLIGIPIRMTIGKKASEGIIEIKFRETGEVVEWQKEEVTEKLQSFFRI